MEIKAHLTFESAVNGGCHPLYWHADKLADELACRGAEEFSLYGMEMSKIQDPTAKTCLVYKRLVAVAMHIASDKGTGSCQNPGVQTFPDKTIKANCGVVSCGAGMMYVSGAICKLI